MINLILDTNIWIQFIAKNSPDGILERLEQACKEDEVVLLSNQIILDEWLRNKEETIRDIVKTIKDCYMSARTVEAVLPDEQKTHFATITRLFSNSDVVSRLVAERVEKVEGLIRGCTQMPIDSGMLEQAAERGLKKIAPFLKNKNSIADAVILLSAAKYCKSNTVGVTDSIFVSFNSKDFCDEKDQDKIHSDLQSILSESGIIFTRNIGHALHLAPKMEQAVSEYIDYMVERYLDADSDFANND